MNATLARLRAETSTSTSNNKTKKTKTKEKKKKKEKEEELPSLTAEWTDERTGGFGILIQEGGGGRGGKGGHFRREDVHCLGCGGVMV